MKSASVPDQVRSACGWVADRARVVRIEKQAIEAYAHGLPLMSRPLELDPETHFAEGDRESCIAFGICLGAINFGSGWWPTIRKRPGRSGYYTVAAGLTERFRNGGGWAAEELARVSTTEIADVVGQDPKHPLMSQFATSLRDVGMHVIDEYGGCFTELVDVADGSAVSLVDTLAGWEAFADVSMYDDRRIPFFKRAQITAADLNRAGIATLDGEDLLTAFADNLVPHVLRLDSVLHLDAALAEAIDAGELLPHGSPAEVELRACAVQAVELLSQATERTLSPAEIDGILWNRGSQARYKAVPRPRSRNTGY